MPKHLLNPNPKLNWQPNQIAYFEKPGEPNKLDWGPVYNIQKPNSLPPDDMQNIHAYKIRILYQHLLRDFTPDQLFESYEQAEQTIKARIQSETEAYTANICNANDLIEFMYKHGFSISHGACKDTAIRNAIKSKAESICGLKLQDF